MCASSAFPFSPDAAVAGAGAGADDRAFGRTTKLFKYAYQPSSYFDGLRRRSHSVLYRSYPSRKGGVTFELKMSSPRGLLEGGMGASGTDREPVGEDGLLPFPRERPGRAAEVVLFRLFERATSCVVDPLDGLLSLDPDAGGGPRNSLNGLRDHCRGGCFVLR